MTFRNCVAVDLGAVFVAGQAAVRVTVKGDARDAGALRA